jgi:hypothetical protein
MNASAAKSLIGPLQLAYSLIPDQQVPTPNPSRFKLKLVVRILTTKRR